MTPRKALNYGGMPLAEVARIIGVTAEGVRTIERYAIRKLWRMTLPHVRTRRRGAAGNVMLGR